MIVTMGQSPPYLEADQKAEMTEEGLMAAYCKGDRGAFEQLFALMGPRVHGFFMRSFKSPAVADDLLQTTFMNVHRARSNIGTTCGYGRGFAIAARVRLDEYRRRGRLFEDPASEDLAASEMSQPVNVELSLEGADRAAIVRTAVEALPESQRAIVHLHRFEGMTFVEIARVLETTEGAVKLRAFRAYEVFAGSSGRCSGSRPPRDLRRHPGERGGSGVA